VNMPKNIIYVKGIWMSYFLEFKKNTPLEHIQMELLRMTDRHVCIVCGQTRIHIDMSKYDGVCMGCIDRAKELGVIK